jgi:hypothetical protein
VRRRCRLALVLPVLAVAVAGCGASLSEEEATFACTNVSVAAASGHGLVDPFSFAQEQMQEEFEMSAPEASDAVREAVSDYCPEFRSVLNG